MLNFLNLLLQQMLYSFVRSFFSFFFHLFHFLIEICALFSSLTQYAERSQFAVDYFVGTGNLNEG